jgi:cobalt-zinc-cadmium efflux system membrane fusion protein
MNILNTRYIILFSLSLVVFTTCTKRLENKIEEEDSREENLVVFTQAQYQMAKIVTGKAEKRIIGTELKVNGIIDVPPHSQISITLPYGGFLKDTDMLPGTKVKKGQLLATIENPDFIQFQQEYLENLAQHEYLEAEFIRQENLFMEEVVSEKIYQQAKSAYMANEVRVKTMGDRLELIGFSLKSLREGKTSSSVNIYSPITGSVLDVDTNVGKYINPEDVIMDITDTRDLHVELSVYENDISHVKDGQVIHFTVTNSPNKIREAEVFLVGSEVREDRSVTVHGHLKNIELDLLPGMYVSAKLIIDTNSVWTISKDAVVRFKGKQYIYLMNNHQQGNQSYQFKMQEVTTGLTEDEFIEIKYTSGLTDIKTDIIVQSGAYSILSELKNSAEENGH